MRTDAEGFTTVTYRKEKLSPKRLTICGKKTNMDGCNIKAAPRKLTVFVGRLDKDVAEADLTEYLVSCGLDDPVCKRLSAKPGQNFRTAAFMISCDAKHKDILNNETTWPSGCEVSEWIFRKKEASAVSS